MRSRENFARDLQDDPSIFWRAVVHQLRYGF
jgi:hypothetical protein